MNAAITAHDGNFNNMRRLVSKLEQRGIAGVCIEDKLFPKTNSFINGAAQPLARVLDKLTPAEQEAFLKAMDLLETELHQQDTGARDAP